MLRLLLVISFKNKNTSKSIFYSLRYGFLICRNCEVAKIKHNSTHRLNNRGRFQKISSGRCWILFDSNFLQEKKIPLAYFDRTKIYIIYRILLKFILLITVNTLVNHCDFNKKDRQNAFFRLNFPNCLSCVHNCDGHSHRIL